MNEIKSTCKDCFHYAACCSCDETGSVENNNINASACENFIATSMVTIKEEN